MRIRVRQGKPRSSVALRVVPDHGAGMVLPGAGDRAAYLVLMMPGGEAHPLLVLAFLAAVCAAGLAGMALMRHRRDRIRRRRYRPPPADDDDLPMEE